MKTKAMKTEVWYLIIGVVFLLGSGLAVVSTAGAQDNGIMEEVESGPMIEGAIGSEINRNWLEFGFSSVGVPATGCSPADPAGTSCGPSSGGNSVFVDAPPWTFTAPPSGVVLTVTDAFNNGDQFEVFDSGNSLGLTSVPSTVGICGSNPDLCLPDPNSSSGTFNLRPGPHSISITPTASPFGSGAAFFRIDEKPLSYFPVKPCKIVDTRNTSAGMIGAFNQRNFHVYGSGGTIAAQGGNPAGCPSPLGEPLAAHINMVAVNPTGKGNLKAFPQGVGATTGLSVNYNIIDTNLANAGTVKTSTGSGPDITVASNFSSAHVTIQVLGYYYPTP